MLKVAIGSIGTVGMRVAARLDEGITGLRLVAASARDIDAARQRLQQFKHPVSVVAADQLAADADVIVECAPAAVFRQIAEPAIDAGKTFIPISVGALLREWDLIDRAKESGARILIPSGALLGLDAVRAANEGTIHSVTMITRKPPGGLAGAPHLVDNGIDVANLQAPLMVFEGSAREGAVGFPANVNVAAALALAGIGPDRTRLQVWADPNVSRNTHTINVDADSARFELKIENIPTKDNPATGKIVALSVISTLRSLTATMVVGS